MTDIAIVPAQLAARLSRGAAELGLTLSATQEAQLLRHLALIEHWGRVYNLTALRDPEQMLVQHLLDSMAVVPPLRRHTGGARTAVLDVGSGAGLPGVTIAVLCGEVSVTCVDAVAKKASFVRQVGGELGLRGFSSVQARVESMAARPWDVITSRAFASLADFVAWTEPLLAPDGVWVAMKGRRPDSEIEELSDDIDVFHVEPLRVPELEAERCLVWMRRRQD